MTTLFTLVGGLFVVTKEDSKIAFLNILMYNRRDVGYILSHKWQFIFQRYFSIRGTYKHDKTIISMIGSLFMNIASYTEINHIALMTNRKLSIHS